MLVAFLIFIVLFLVAAISYLIGSIPTGYLVVKFLTGEDIRQMGSGSTGATNVKRILGKKWFITVMLIDAIKGFLPVFIVRYFINDSLGLFAVLSAVFVIVGHSKPVFLQFKGGKSVASGIGTMIALNPIAGLITAVIWAIISFATKYVSVGSIIAVSVSPFLMYFIKLHEGAKNPKCYVLYCILAALYIIFLHRQNIVRLFKGEENKVRQ